MQIDQNSVVSIHYTLTNDEGTVIDSSINIDPLVYLQGAGNIIPGLENALVGKSAGDTLTVRIAPEDGYGATELEVTAVNGNMVTIDANHPLAGQHLNFDVTVVEVRAATQEEMDHGHVHGHGGHHH